MFEYSSLKNELLRSGRDITFDDVINMIENGEFLDLISHPNQQKYPGQQVYILDVEGYCYLVPHIRDGNKVFLKTIIPSRKATKDYLDKK